MNQTNAIKFNDDEIWGWLVEDGCLMTVWSLAFSDFLDEPERQYVQETVSEHEASCGGWCFHRVRKKWNTIRDPNKRCAALLGRVGAEEGTTPSFFDARCSQSYGLTCSATRSGLSTIVFVGTNYAAVTPNALADFMEWVTVTDY